MATPRKVVAKGMGASTRRDIKARNQSTVARYHAKAAIAGARINQHSSVMLVPPKTYHNPLANRHVPTTMVVNEGVFGRHGTASEMRKVNRSEQKAKAAFAAVQKSGYKPEPTGLKPHAPHGGGRTYRRDARGRFA